MSVLPKARLTMGFINQGRPAVQPEKTAMNRSEIANSRRWGRIYSRARRLTRYQLFSETTEGFVLKLLFPFPLLAAAP